MTSVRKVAVKKDVLKQKYNTLQLESIISPRQLIAPRVDSSRAKKKKKGIVHLKGHDVELYRWFFFYIKEKEYKYEDETFVGKIKWLKKKKIE